jgi:alkanesulfonate monooxygenase SsuD/methylene tetrahydromethanopterin reductase-like flavin-dependent oxidoreductase (luciferase family)
VRFGVQTALQNTTPGELILLWGRIEAAGYEWISVWDHFHAVGGGTDNLEAVSMHSALALSTERVRCGGLVYSIGYRSVAVLANAIASIDQLSGGRATLGLGTGYLQAEYDAWGLVLPSVRDRLDQLEETVQALRAVLSGRVTTCRTIPMAGRLADGWNVPMATVADFGRKPAVFDAAAEAAGRDPGRLERSVGVGLCWDPERLVDRFGERAEIMRPAILSGSIDEVTDRVGRYRAAGADWLLLSVRAPFDAEELDRFAEEVVPALG